MLISFFAGVITILTPCVLPLLPVIVGGSLVSHVLSKRKAYIVIISLGVSILVFTFLLKVSTLFINVPQYVWPWISGSILICVGLVYIFPRLWESRLTAKLNIQSQYIIGKGIQKDTVWGYILIGAALGPCFSTCSPTYFILLATVLPTSLALGSLYMISYVIGLCLSLLCVVFLSASFLKKIGVVSDPRGYFKKSIGVLFIGMGILVSMGADKKVEAVLPTQKFFNPIVLEQKLLEMRSTQVNSTKGSSPSQKAVPIEVIQKIIEAPSDRSTLQPKVTTIDTSYKDRRLAPEISTPDGFINTLGKPITLNELRGKKVILVSFWTYSCINCKRTLPYFNDWYTKYKDQGLEIVSIHTPEFSFEHVLKNVQSAVATHKIEYPVVLDNDYSTWSSYGNQYWPRRYLVNKDGYIIYDHIGEGDYEETEDKIKIALEELNTQ